MSGRPVKRVVKIYLGDRQPGPEYEALLKAVALHLRPRDVEIHVGATAEPEVADEDLETRINAKVGEALDRKDAEEVVEPPQENDGAVVGEENGGDEQLSKLERLKKGMKKVGGWVDKKTDVAIDAAVKEVSRQTRGE